jgi:hypothetical protein
MIKVHYMHVRTQNNETLKTEKKQEEWEVRRKRE